MLDSTTTKFAHVKPADTGATLVNPQMGWAFHHYDNNIVRYGLDLEPSDTVDDFPGASVIYLRLAWSYLEPEEGKFNWSLVDTPAQRWFQQMHRCPRPWRAGRKRKARPP